MTYKKFECPSDCASAAQCAMLEDIMHIREATDPQYVDISQIAEAEAARLRKLRDGLIVACAVFEQAV